MTRERSLKEEFETYGRVWLRNAVSNEDLALFDRAADAPAKAGKRLDMSKALREALSEDSSLVSAVRRLAPHTHPVRIVAFNKSGIWHCEPPESILDEMLFVRVHLADTDQTNGAMEIAVGSHAEGVVEFARANTAASSYPIELCSAKRGDVLILKMLTLHASKPAKVKSGRRVLRIDFSPSHLPSPLAWSGRCTES
ncbi:phytanoyl-CoA dioxygenase family protein [Cereibacter sphaeroides]|nr:phytanoyl-CoA dioxygenase family protein [Cereibacter sphaeroides]